jgi:glycosyltransferase involved in cell wall biosynthesis
MAGIGVQRIAKLTGHLPATGWRPVVVTTPAWSFRMRKDPSLLAEMPGDLEIHRPFFFDSRKILPGDLAKVIAPIEKRLFFPDKFRIWNAGVIRWMASAFADHPADVVFINVPPFSGLNLAEKIKRKFRVPVVLGFRDAFSFNNYLLLDPDPAAAAAAAELEGRAFSAADALVFTTPYMMRKYGELFPGHAGKMSVITNGYDEDDFTGIESGRFSGWTQPGGEVFTVGYNGSHSRLAPMAPLADALCAIYETRGLRIRLNIATNEPLPKFKAKFPKLFEHGLVDFKGFLPHRESLRNLSGCHLLAFMFADSPATEGAYSGKVFEYLRIGRPIVLLHRKDSDIARLIAGTGSGTTAGIGSPDEIVKTLLHYHDLWKSGRQAHAPDLEKIRAYDYRNLTLSLARIFEKTAGLGA